MIEKDLRFGVCLVLDYWTVEILDINEDMHGQLQLIQVCGFAGQILLADNFYSEFFFSLHRHSILTQEIW